MLNDDALRRHEVRLFPSAHIKTEREAELRATASLLAMVRAVSEFGRALVRHAGGPAGRLSCYTEVPFQLEGRGTAPPSGVRPDGIILAARGKTRWRAMMEVKVGRAELDPEQVDKYHRLARQEGIDALITISNQPALPNGRPPISLDGRRLRSIPVTHFSWERLLSEAQLLSTRKAVSDPDQKWMLDEWIRYVDDDASKIIEPPDLGLKWNDVLTAARTGDLGTADGLPDVVRHWTGFLRKAALRLRAKLGVEVKPKLSRADLSDPAAHVQRLIAEARNNSVLSGTLRIPDAIGDVSIELFLHSQSIRFGVGFRAPTEGRQATRISWLARQLRTIATLPQGLEVLVDWTTRGLETRAIADKFLAQPSVVAVDSRGIPIAKEERPRRFLLSASSRLPRARGRSSSQVLEYVSTSLEDFYRNVVENLVPFVPRAPRLPSDKGEYHHRAEVNDQLEEKEDDRSMPTSPSVSTEIHPEVAHTELDVHPNKIDTVEDGQPAQLE